MTRKYDYPTAFSDWGPGEHDAIDRVMRSGQHTMGSEVAAFEREFAALHGKRHAIMVNSGSSANLVMIAALCHLRESPLKRGDKVAVPALAWSTTYAPLVQHGLDLVLLDCGDDWCAAPYGPLPDDFHDCRLVVGCSILGSPTDASQWASAAGVIGARYVEDNCESLGSLDQDGRRTGTRGLMCTFSFFYSHQVSAIEGGAIVTDDDECAALCRMLRAHGWTRDVADPTETVPFDREYDFRFHGYNVRPTELHAVIARVQLARLPELTARRRANLGTFLRLAGDLPISPPVARGTPDPFGIAFCVKDSGTGQRLVFALRDSGVDCRMPTGGSFRRHLYGEPWCDQMTPMADRIHDCGMFIGNGPVDLTSGIELAADVMRSALS